MIGSITHTLAIRPTQTSGNNLPNEGKSLPGKLAPSSSISLSIERKPSSIEELEIYFKEKISFLEERGHDTINAIALRDAIREASENKNGDSPSLPNVIEHPYGGKFLGNIHTSFGTEVKGDLKDFTKVSSTLSNITYSHLKNNNHENDKNLADRQNPNANEEFNMISSLKEQIEHHNSKGSPTANFEDDLALLESFKDFRENSSIDTYT